MSERSRYNPSVSIKTPKVANESSPNIQEELFVASRKDRDQQVSKEDQKANISFDSWKAQYFRLVQDIQLVKKLFYVVVKIYL